MSRSLENPVAYAILLGSLGVFLSFVSGRTWLAPQHAEYRPLPHQVPKLGGGTSLRFAMVHDVLTQRYPTHGEAYYAARRDQAQAALDALQPIQGPPAWDTLDLFDDLGVALDKLHHSDQAADVLRTKATLLARHGPPPKPVVDDIEEVLLQLALEEPELTPLQRAHYRTHANLGTFLIHGSLRLARQGDADARARLKEGEDHIREAIAINPGAHFGRESWQLICVETVRATFEDPELLRQFDLIGNHLRTYLLGTINRPTAVGRGFGRIAHFDPQTAGELDSATRSGLRSGITAVGNEDGFRERTQSTLISAAPFDEPTLGIVGMWLLGGGPNPHFALALGQIMERVGQRHLAWTAFERATHMAERFSPDPDDQTWFVEHCRKHQQRLEDELQADPQDLRAAFDRDLAEGEDYQRRYQQLEAERIAQGHDLDTLAAEIEEELGPIATAPGRADWAWVEEPAPNAQLWLLLAMGSAGAGLGAWLGRARDRLSAPRRG